MPASGRSFWTKPTGTPVAGHQASGHPNSLLEFMLDAAQSQHVILGTATPVQTDVEELWDLLEILNRGAEHVLGRSGVSGGVPATAIPVSPARRRLRRAEAWHWLRNPLPAKGRTAFRPDPRDLGLKPDRFYTDKPVTDLETLHPDGIAGRHRRPRGGPQFFQAQSDPAPHRAPKAGHARRLGLLDRIAVDIWPSENERLPMFEGVGLHTSSEFEWPMRRPRISPSRYERGSSPAGSCSPCSNSGSAPAWPGESPPPSGFWKTGPVAVEGEDDVGPGGAREPAGDP